MPKKLLLLLSLLVYLNILDLYTTHILLSLGGKELNPVFSHFNATGIGFVDVVVKMSSAVTMVFVLWLFYKTGKKRNAKWAVVIVYVFAIGLNLFYIFVVWNNIRMLQFQIEEVRRVLGGI